MIPDKIKELLLSTNPEHINLALAIVSPDLGIDISHYKTTPEYEYYLIGDVDCYILIGNIILCLLNAKHIQVFNTDDVGWFGFSNIFPIYVVEPYSGSLEELVNNVIKENHEKFNSIITTSNSIKLQ
jgi:hypothetical protein